MPEKIFGLPLWAAIGTLAGAGVVGYLLFFRNQGGSSSGQSTYSAQGLTVMANPDESATMAAQNQLLSQLAVNQAAGFQTLSGQVGEVGSGVDNGFSSVGSSLNSIGGQLGTLQSTQTAGFTGISNQVSQDATANAAYYAQMQSALASMGSTLSAGQSTLSQQMGSYYNGLAQQLANVQAGTATLDAGLAQQLNNIGNFLGWQFYQIPNRYQALIPGGNLNVSQGGSGGGGTSSSSGLPMPNPFTPTRLAPASGQSWGILT